MRTIKTRKFILRNIYSGIDLQIAEVGENYHTTCYTYHLEDFFNELKNTPQAG